MSEPANAWIPAWDIVPDLGDEVVVKVVLSGNVFQHAVGSYGENGWTVEGYVPARVAAWLPLPQGSRKTGKRDSPMAG